MLACMETQGFESGRVGCGHVELRNDAVLQVCRAATRCAIKVLRLLAPGLARADRRPIIGNPGHICPDQIAVVVLLSGQVECSATAAWKCASGHRARRAAREYPDRRSNRYRRTIYRQGRAEGHGSLCRRT